MSVFTPHPKDNSRAKFRAFVAEERTGRPVPWHPVVLEGSVSDAQDWSVLYLLQSDHAGYLSVPFPDGLSQTRLASVGDPLEEVVAKVASIREKILDEGTPAVHLLSIVSRAARASQGQQPAIIGADILDWSLSPGSFGSSAGQPLGEHGCGEFLPSTASTLTYRLIEVSRNLDFPEALTQIPAQESPCEAANHADWSSRVPPAPMCRRPGLAFDYEINWHPAGHALGELLYSLPLAPSESVNLVIIDWRREDAVDRREDISAEDQLTHNLHRDRSIDETKKGSLEQSQFGASLTAGISGAASGIPIGISGGFSASRGSRRTTAEAGQRLSDNIAEAATLRRRMNSTVIVQGTGRERESIETRNVTNHNHCHTLTILYYEVVRHYRVVTRVTRRRPVLFLKRPTHSFDRRSIWNNRRVIEANLLDDGLKACFPALEKRFCYEEITEGYVDTDDRPIVRLEAVVRMGARGLSTGREWLRIMLVLSDGTELRLFPEVPPDVGPGDTARQRDNSILGWAYSPSASQYVRFRSDQAELVQLVPDREVTVSSVSAIVIERGCDRTAYHVAGATPAPPEADPIVVSDLQLVAIGGAYRIPLYDGPPWPGDRKRESHRACRSA